MHAFDRRTDRRTDRILIAIDGVCISCSAVKTFWSLLSGCTVKVFAFPVY